MFDAVLVTTSSEGLQPLGSAAQRSYELISGTLRARLGPAHANLFAEPVATPHGDRIDWHSPVPGKAVALPDLPGAEQEQLRHRLGALIGDIRAEAERLGESASADDQRLSEALLNAIEIPDEAMIHAVRGDNDEGGGDLNPVLVHWAWVRDEQKPVRGILTAMVARARPPVSAAAAPVVAGGGWSAIWWPLIVLGWLLLAVLLGIILYLMIAPCGLNQGRLVFCSPEEPMVSAAITERRVIEDEIARLERELALRGRACRPTIPLTPAPLNVPPATPSTPEPVPAPEQPAPEPVIAPEDRTKTDRDRADVDRRIAERGAERGGLNFVLEWGSTDDIDLSVTCPAGQTVSYKNRGNCNARYDLDANVTRATAVTDPVENVVFQEVVPGIYIVTARLKGNRTDGDKPVTLHVLRQDGRSQSYSGTVGRTRPEWTVNISISR